MLQVLDYSFRSLAKSIRRVVIAMGFACLASSCAETGDKPDVHPGEDTYVKYCAACHNAGVADAPKLGVSDEWGERLVKGKSALVQSTIDGMPPGMPKKGLCMSCSEQDLSDAVDYMLEALD